MTSGKASTPELRQTLTDLKTRLVALEQALAAEYAAVRDFDGDALEQSVADKSTALAQIAELEVNRRTILAAAGMADGSESMRIVAAQDDISTGLWLEVEALTRSVRRATETNTVLLHAHHRLAIDSLHALYGERSEPELYQDRAEVRPRALARSLGRV